MQTLLETYGAKGYLACLRNRYRAGNYTWPQYALRAAAAYLIDKKPKRAQALINTLDAKQLTIKEDAAYAGIIRQINSCAPLPYSDCSLNIIAKNESENIAAALDSADSYFDEIVICDTGSQDDTCEQAKLYGTVITRDAWHNDFSRARNKAIDNSSCAWIFWMDADDRIDTATFDALVPIWRAGPRRAIAVCVRNQIGGSAPVDFLQVRLFPRRDDIRFERKIHEQIMFSAVRAGIEFANVEAVRVIHAGYHNANDYQDKIKRNQRLIKEELARTPSDPSLLLALADGYATLGDIDSATETYRQLCDDERAFETNADAFVQAHINLGLLEFRRRNMYEAKRYLYRSLYCDSARIEAFYLLGRICLSGNDEKEAAEFFIRASGPKPRLRMTAVNNTMVRLESLYYLSELLLKWGNYREMEDLLTSALVQYPMVPRFYTQLGKSMFMRRAYKDAATMFMQSISLCPAKNDEAYIGIAEIYSAIGDYDSAFNYLNAALSNGGNPARIHKLRKKIILAQREISPVI